MIDASFLSWPFFEDRHRHFADDLNAWAAREVKPLVDHHDVDASCRRLVRALGRGRMAQGGGAAGLWRALPVLRRAHPVPGARNPGLS